MTEVKEDIKIDVTDGKEKVKVEIKDNSNSGNVKIKEVKKQLQILTSNQASLITPKINGKLLNFIIVTNKQIDIVIRLKSYPNIELYSVRALSGVKYLPLRANTFDSKGDLYTFGGDYHYLNDQLEILVEGMGNTTVDVICRYI